MNRMLLAPVLVLAGSGAAMALASCSSDSATDRFADSQQTTAASSTTTPHEGVTHDFVIPEGTAAIVKKGGDPGIIPARLDVHVGDRIRVRNNDTQIARLGIFDVGPGETMTMTFNEVNVLTGVIFGQGAEGCGAPIPENKKFIINVRP